jgi:hypothetical protein
MILCILTGISKSTRVGRHGSSLSRSKVMIQVSVGSTAPKEESKDFHCDGKVWRTSKTNMDVEDCAKSLTRL